MSIERLISQKHGGQTAKSRAARRVALIGTTLCFAVMVVSISVERGFRSAIENRMQTLLSDFRLVDNNAWLSDTSPLVFDDEFASDVSHLNGVRRVMETYEAAAVAQNPDTGENCGAMLRGVDFDKMGVDFAKLITSGTLMSANEQNTQDPQVIVSATFSREAAISVGQAIDLIIINDTMPRKARATVAAIFDTSLPDIERPMIFAPIDFVRHFAAADAVAITAYEVSGAVDATELEELAAQYSLRTISLDERAGELFDWLGMLQSNVLLVLIIMLAVALINVAGSALIIILESTQTIALLGALGMRRGSLQRIFFRRTASIINRGALYGVLAGVVIIVVQNTFGIVTLDPANYFVEVLPLTFAPIEILSTIAAALAAVYGVVWLSTRIVSRIEIAKGLKFE